MSEYVLGYRDGAAYVVELVSEHVDGRIGRGSADGRLVLTELRDSLHPHLAKWRERDVVELPQPKVEEVDHHALGRVEGFEQGREAGIREAHATMTEYQDGRRDALRAVVDYFDRKIRYGQGGDRSAYLALLESMKAEFGLV